MGKYKILTEGLLIDGNELKKDSIVDLNCQIGENYVSRGWAEKAVEDPKSKTRKGDA